MIYQEGYVYHIKDEYFEKVQDSNLMQNKEGGTYRPTFYCLRDNKTSLLWMVPLSSRVEKFKAIHDKQVAKYGKCLTIVLGEFDGKEAVIIPLRRSRLSGKTETICPDRRKPLNLLLCEAKPHVCYCA